MIMILPITYPTEDSTDGTQDTDTSGDASGDTQIDYDTGGSDSDSELFNENLVQEETYY